MNDSEKIQSFSDLVNAAERLTKPWRWALIITNCLWAVVFLAFILLAYLTPETTYQYQDAKSAQQVQSTGSELVTNGQ